MTGQFTIPYADYSRYSPGFGCRGICETSELLTKTSRKKGQTAQEAGIKYCRRCAEHFKKEAGFRCPCCRQPLSGRIRSKQSKRYREQVVLAKATKENTIPNI